MLARLAMDDLETKNENGNRFNLKGLISGSYHVVAGDSFSLDLEVEDQQGKLYLYKVQLFYPLFRDPVRITGKLIPERPKADELLGSVSHNFEKLADTKKNCLLHLFKKRSCRAGKFPRTIVCVQRKTECDEVAKALVTQNLRVVACCSKRESEAVNEFRRGLADILVVPSGGLGVDQVAAHVVNLNLPKSFKEYVSRIGWTEHGGRVTSFYTDRDMGLVSEIKKAIADAEAGKGTSTHG
ncbi:RNA helicase [Ranunculus cassubicifolius]